MSMNPLFYLKGLRTYMFAFLLILEEILVQCLNSGGITDTAELKERIVIALVIAALRTVTTTGPGQRM